MSGNGLLSVSLNDGGRNLSGQNNVVQPLLTGKGELFEKMSGSRKPCVLKMCTTACHSRFVRKCVVL